MMRSRIAACIVLLLALMAQLAIAPLARGQDSTSHARSIAEQLLEQAQAAYDEGVSLLTSDREAAQRSFAASAAAFGELIEPNGSADSVGLQNGYLYYNLGNAQFQAGNIGEAILAYRRAQRYIPGDGRLERNLEAARSQREDHFDANGAAAIGSFLWELPTRMPSRALFSVFAIAYLAFWLAVMLIIVRPGARSGGGARPSNVRLNSWGVWGGVAVMSTIVWLAAGTMLMIQRVHESGMRDAVIVAPSVVVRKGNGEGFEKQFEEPLHGGTECIVVSERADWLEIELPNGSRGWIPRAAAGVVGGV